MKIHIQTRGRIRDYTFLGDVPEKKWWRQPVYEQGTSFEKPTLIIENDTSGWRCYIGGILSNRRDRVNTPIRYTLVINEDKKTPTEIKNILSLVFSALQAFSSPSSNLLQEILDKTFDFDLDAFIDGNKTKNINSLLEKIIQDKRIQEFPIDKKKFSNKIEEIIKQKKSEGSSNAVAFLNLVSNKYYIDSEIQPAFNESKLNRLSLIESLSSGNMFNDLTKSSKNEAPPTGDTSTSNEAKSNKKKIRMMLVAITVIALAALILNLYQSN